MFFDLYSRVLLCCMLSQSFCTRFYHREDSIFLLFGINIIGDFCYTRYPLHVLLSEAWIYVRRLFSQFISLCYRIVRIFIICEYYVEKLYALHACLCCVHFVYVATYLLLSFRDGMTPWAVGVSFNVFPLSSLCCIMRIYFSAVFPSICFSVIFAHALVQLMTINSIIYFLLLVNTIHS